jgi:hypothetical protein
VREDQHEDSIPDAPSAPLPPAAIPAPDAPATTAAPSSPFQELDSRPHVFDEHGYQVSIDRQFWWNGAVWVPGQPPASHSADRGPGFTAVQAVIAIGGLILFAGFAFSVCQSMPGSAFPAP